MILTCDTEVSIYNKGHPFDKRNIFCANVWKVDNQPARVDQSLVKEFIKAIEDCSLIVFFNAKFDLHWYRKLGLNLQHKKIWCCQLAEYILSYQRIRYPSLEETAIKYGLGHKEDVVKTEYWDKGISTEFIPWNILESYGAQDGNLTYQVYLKQLEQFEQKPHLYYLFLLACQDIHVLQEMEWNGLRLDVALCEKKATEIEEQIKDIYITLSSVYPDVQINFGSPDQLSAFLYGGIVKEEYKEHVGFYKTGKQAGQPKYANRVKEHILPRLVQPIKGSELKKEGLFGTSEDILNKLKGPNAKKFVGPLLELARLEKLNSTYYRGLLKKCLEKHWEGNEIHGQFNQSVTQTGRLSSSDPNLQNLAGDSLDIFISRYEV